MLCDIVAFYRVLAAASQPGLLRLKHTLLVCLHSYLSLRILHIALGVNCPHPIRHQIDASSGVAAISQRNTAATVISQINGQQQAGA